MVTEKAYLINEIYRMSQQRHDQSERAEQYYDLFSRLGIKGLDHIESQKIESQKRKIEELRGVISRLLVAAKALSSLGISPEGDIGASAWKTACDTVDELDDISDLWSVA